MRASGLASREYNRTGRTCLYRFWFIMVPKQRMPDITTVSYPVRRITLSLLYDPFDQITGDVYSAGNTRSPSREERVIDRFILGYAWLRTYMP